MPPQLALFLMFGFVVYLIRRDSKRWATPSRALWFPVVWICFVGSRFPSQWLDLFGISVGGGAVEDGSPFDAVFFLLLIVAGIAVLRRRNFDLKALAKENFWFTVFFVYCLLAVFWSDFPFVASKRWIKTLGHPVMALLILTDPRPDLAFRWVMKRCGFLLLPLSVLFIKYYPQYGRGFDSWTGQSANRGASLNKNELGYVCFIFGVFFIWNFLNDRRITDKNFRRGELLISAVFVCMALWLLKMASSATSLASLIIASMTIIALGFRFVSKKYFGTTVLVAIIIAAAAEMSIGIYKPTLALLGRNETLTDRTEVWADALALQRSPILGTGFESFWLGYRLKTLWAKWWWHPIQAHNGYIETYLNLGAIGVLLLFVLFLSIFRSIAAKLTTDFEFSRLRMGFFFAILAYNFSEATFTGVALVWTLFHIIALDVPRVVAPITESVFQDTAEEGLPMGIDLNLDELNLPS
jgi:exopolysaccharide production protein ExoQ